MYDCNFIADGDTLTQSFFKGNYNNLVEQLNLVGKNINDSTILNDFNFGMKRVNYLSDLTEREVNSNMNSKNMVFWARSLCDLVKENKTKKAHGTFLKTYQAKNSGKRYSYLFHISPSLSIMKDIPIVFITPYTFTDGYPVIESYYLRNLDQIAVDSKLADDYGFALCWLFQRGSDYTPEIAAEDFDGVLKNLSKQYSIDHERLYVMGDCHSGLKALILAQRKPEAFAGIGLMSPITKGIYSKDALIHNVELLSEIPVFISHGINDQSVPISDTRNYVKKARDKGVDIEYIEEIDGHFSFTKSYREPIFKFLARQK